VLIASMPGARDLDTEDSMAERKCAHAACNCKVSGDDRYCSAHCREHAGCSAGASGGAGGCGCGHPGCR
jgi:hypothetical protein